MRCSFHMFSLHHMDTALWKRALLEDLSVLLYLFDGLKRLPMRVNETQVSYSTNCPGDVLTSTPPGKTFDEVTASVVVLTRKTPAGSTYAASAWSASMATLIKAPFSKLVLTLLLQTAKGPMMLGMSDTQITPMTFYRHFC
jgi:hypothetical protein